MNKTGTMQRTGTSDALAELRHLARLSVLLRRGLAHYTNMERRRTRFVTARPDAVSGKADLGSGGDSI